MYTRCPECQTVHVLRASELAHASGVVSCGNCRKVYNALQHLYDEPPQPEDPPAADAGGAVGMPPLLQPLLILSDESEPPEKPAPDALDPEADSVATGDAQAQPEETLESQATSAVAMLSGERRSAQLPVLVWAVLTGVLLTALAFQLWQLYEYRQQLAEMERLASIARAPEAFRIVSRDVHPHPSVNRAQMVSLRMRNTADHPQPYPVLEVDLLDTTENVVAVRRFHADEYLPPGNDPQRLVEVAEDFAVVLQLRTPIGGNGGMIFTVR